MNEILAAHIASMTEAVNVLQLAVSGNTALIVDSNKMLLDAIEAALSGEIPPEQLAVLASLDESIRARTAELLAAAAANPLPGRPTVVEPSPAQPDSPVVPPTV